MSITSGLLKLGLVFLLPIVGLLMLALTIGASVDSWVIRYTTLNPTDPEFTLIREDVARDLNTYMLHIPAPRHNDTDINFSLDGRYAIVASGTTIDNASVLIIDLQANTTVELGGSRQLISPDLHHFIYGSDGDFFLVDVTQPDSQYWQEISIGAQFVWGTWSDDGRYFVYGQQIDGDTMLMMVDTYNNYNQQELQTEGIALGLTLSWSPDGQIIIARDDNPFASTPLALNPHLYAIELDMTHPDNLQTTFIGDAVSSAMNFMKWSSDSRYFFSGFADFFMQEATTQIYDFETGVSCQLMMPSELASGLYSLTWSSVDNDWIMISLAGGFYRINPETCERTTAVIVPFAVGDESVIWSSDYSQFVIQTRHGLFWADINGNIIRQISDDGTAQLR